MNSSLIQKKEIKKYYVASLLIILVRKALERKPAEVDRQAAEST